MNHNTMKIKSFRTLLELIKSNTVSIDPFKLELLIARTLERPKPMTKKRKRRVRKAYSEVKFKPKPMKQVILN